MNGIARPLAISFAVVALLSGCTSADSSASSSPTSTADAGELTASGPEAVALDSLELPQDGQLFDEGRWDTPIEAGVPVEVALRLTPCGREVLGARPALRVEWTPNGLDGPVVSTVLTPAATDQWEGTVTFSEAGNWRADPALGIGAFVDVVAADLGLVSPSPDLPLPAAPQTIAVLDGDATEVLRSFTGELGGVGLLRDPDRAVFVQAREGGRWLVTGDVETGEVDPLFEGEAFTNVYPAPDGRAVAVEWGDPATGERELRIVTAAGRVTAVDDETINHMTVAWAPDSSALLVASDSLRLLAPDGQVRAEHPFSGTSSTVVEWAPDAGRVLLRTFREGAGAVLLGLDPASGNLDTLIDAERGIPMRSVQFSPQGDRLALLWNDNEEHHIAVAPAHAATPEDLLDDVLFTTSNTSRPQALAWSPDGRSLVFAASRPLSDGVEAGASAVYLLQVGSGEVRLLAEAPDYYSGQPQGLAWTADGSTLFALRDNCTGCEPSSSAVDVIDVSAGRTIETFEDTSFRGMTVEGTAALLSTPEGLVPYGRTYDQPAARLVPRSHLLRALGGDARGRRLGGTAPTVWRRQECAS